jgi:hypothetical protein
MFKSIKKWLKPEPTLIEKWIAALRSGEYAQGSGQLRDSNTGPGRPVEYCCLGVLCDVAGLEPDADSDTYMGNEAYPPALVVGMLGLDVSQVDPGERVVLRLDDDLDDAESSLDHLNDNGRSFAEIADLIEANGVRIR